jgi:hypothetical protein
MHAAEQVLSVPSRGQAARGRAAALAGVDGTANAADEVERVLAAPASAHQARRMKSRISLAFDPRYGGDISRNRR